MSRWKNRNFLSFFWVVLSLFLLSCNSSSSELGPPATLTIVPSQVSLAEGETQQLTVEVRDANGNRLGEVTVVWKSSSPPVAMVNASGTLSAETIGTSEVTASFSTATGTIASSPARIGVYSATKKGSQTGNVSGVVRYEDKEFNINGMTGDITREPIPSAVVQVIRLFDFTTIATGTTGSDGTFSISISNSGAAGVYLRVLSQSDTIQVQNNATDRAVYAVTTEGIDDSVVQSGITLLASKATVAGGAFNIYSTLMRGIEKVKEAETTIPLSISYWEPGSQGTFYDDQEDRIYILGISTDPDQYDDAVILHEYGHFLESHFARIDSTGGDHSIADNTQDIRLSWSEGWGNFFAGVARESSLYVDTNGSGSSIVSYDMEDLSSPGLPTLSNFAIYTTNEIAVAAVLWDFYDDLSKAEVFDTLNLTFTEIWNVFRDFTSDQYSGRVTSFELYWDVQKVTVTEGDLLSVTQNRQIRLTAQNDSDASTPVVLTPNSSQSQEHTLYPEDDVDYFSFQLPPGNWIVQTQNLSNGADTYLEVLDFMTIIGANDNQSGLPYSKTCGYNAVTRLSNCPSNDRDNLSSSVSFPVSFPGTFQASVRHSADAPPSAGIYGTYEITVGPLP